MQFRAYFVRCCTFFLFVSFLLCFVLHTAQSAILFPFFCHFIRAFIQSFIARVSRFLRTFVLSSLFSSATNLLFIWCIGIRSNRTICFFLCVLMCTFPEYIGQIYKFYIPSEMHPSPLHLFLVAWNLMIHFFGLVFIEFLCLSEKLLNTIMLSYFLPFRTSNACEIGYKRSSTANNE